MHLVACPGRDFPHPAWHCRVPRSDDVTVREWRYRVDAEMMMKARTRLWSSVITIDSSKTPVADPLTSSIGFDSIVQEG